MAFNSAYVPSATAQSLRDTAAGYLIPFILPYSFDSFQLLSLLTGPGPQVPLEWESCLSCPPLSQELRRMSSWAQGCRPIILSTLEAKVEG